MDGGGREGGKGFELFTEQQQQLPHQTSTFSCKGFYSLSAFVVKVVVLIVMVLY